MPALANAETVTDRLPDTGAKTAGQMKWQELETFYLQKVNGITVPPDPAPPEIRRLRSDLSNLFTQARVDLARTKRAYEKLERKESVARKTAILAVPKNPTNPDGSPMLDEKQKPISLTEKEREALSIQRLDTAPLPGMNLPVYQALEIAEERLRFMEAIVEVIKEKSDALLTDLATLKIDAQINDTEEAASARRGGE